MSTPVVPPRPSRKLDPSPIRDVRSPLNQLPHAPPSTSKPSTLATEDVPPRPPSVAALPSIGQEGSEYATYDLLPPEVPGVTNAASTALETPEQTRNIAEGMTLHAPKASLPQSTAKSRIETVTRTDSTQAAAAGIGQARPLDDVHRTPADSTATLDRVPSTEPNALRPTVSVNRPPSGASHGSRPASIYEDFHEHGIPHIGVHTPLNPNAGDVQAPSGPAQSQYAPGVGFFNDGSSKAHQRKKSGRHEFGPPGSYGLHSHSVQPHDKFEREWYAKNRDKAAMEENNLYGRPKPETALSSAELNRIVTQSDAAGSGSASNAISTPGEELAFTASDAYVARISPKTSPMPGRQTRKRLSSGSQPAVESPLRRTSYPFPKSQQAVEDDDVDVIHIDPPEYNTSRATGGGPVDGAVDLGQHAGNTAEEGGWFIERGPGTPALASDEVLKRQESSSMQPAVNPDQHFDSYDEYARYDNSRRSSMRVPSRPSSRPGSVHGDYPGGLHRFISHDDHHRGSENHTPLEEIEEYEPLIPEGEEETPKPKPKVKEIKRRPGIEHHHFPSRDIWEDTPSSMYYHTTVETPDIDPEEQTAPPPANGSKSPEAPIEQIQSDDTSAAKPVLKPHYATRAIDNRPGVQRFPSKDVWEDTPTSLQYHTTVGGPQMDDSRSPPDDRPTTSAIPGSQDDNEARATTGFTQVMRPSVPARPQKRSNLAKEVKPDDEDGQKETSRELAEEKPPSPEKTKAPPIPDRPKPTVPARPTRGSRSERTNGASAELAKTTSRDSQSSGEAVTSPPVPKAKPVVPARPAGEKIAALKAGFMSDLNNRLKLGPQQGPSKTREIEPEVVEETPKAPLADARKGRAKGPARRKPAASPSAAAEEKTIAFSISTPSTIWSIDKNDKLQVPSTNTTAPVVGAVETADAADAADAPALEKAMSNNEAANPPEPAPSGDSPQPEKVEASDFAANTEEITASTDLHQLQTVLSETEAKNTEEPTLVKPASLEGVQSPPPSAASIEAASPEEKKSMQASLEASLAKVGAAPASLGTDKSATSTAEGQDVVEDTATVDRDGGEEAVAEEEIKGVAAS